MIAIGVIRMEHPFRALAPQHGEIRIAIDQGRAQHLAGKGDGARHILDQQIDGEPAKRAPVIGRAHPGLLFAALLDHDPPRLPRLPASRQRYFCRCWASTFSLSMMFWISGEGVLSPSGCWGSVATFVPPAPPLALTLAEAMLEGAG